METRCPRCDGRCTYALQGDATGVGAGYAGLASAIRRRRHTQRFSTFVDHVRSKYDSQGAHVSPESRLGRVRGLERIEHRNKSEDRRDNGLSFIHLRAPVFRVWNN
ncbi:hypothetical protein PUNSTDRAFT_54738, partial [Punctularia strigosozonata HHB-11173 SS5]|uniref:uncharacterized protein n=1 Tax=Punctularia strigosozonata (strain HHB-11173) TaxID=741275 RepID=UPI0004417B23